MTTLTDELARLTTVTLWWTLLGVGIADLIAVGHRRKAAR